jgi:hypothetical protein
MTIFYKLMWMVGCGFGWLCGMCMKGFFFILAISSDRKPLMIVTIALMPIGLMLVAFAVFLFPLSAIFGMVAYHGLRVSGVLQNAGISLAGRTRRAQRLLAWADIKEFRRVFMPPGHSFRAVLQSGEVVKIDEIETNALRVALEQRRIPFLGKDKNMFEYEF